MAVFSKKLYIKNSAGVQQTCNIYSTTSEAGSAHMYATVDGTQGYIPLVSTSSSYASSGRVLKSGTTYAIGKAGVPAYDYRVMSPETPWYYIDNYTSWADYYNGDSSKLIIASSGTFTVPSGVYKLRVTCVGGGAGSMNDYVATDAIKGTESNTTKWTFNHVSRLRYAPATSGGATAFGSVSANGASCALITYNITPSTCTECTGGTENETCRDYTCYTFVSVIPATGSINGQYGVDGQYDGFYATAPISVTNVYGTLLCYAGGGAFVDGQRENIYGGATAYSTVTTLNVTPGQAISWYVGNRGVGWDDDTLVEKGYRHKNDSGDGAGSGTNGCILVEWGGSIV